MKTSVILHGQRSGPFEITKCFFLANTVAAVAVCAWLDLRSPAARARDVALVACGVIFVLRTIFMVLRLLARRIGWREAIGDSLVVWAVLYGLLVYWAGAQTQLGPRDIVALTLFLAGSTLTTGSELARRNWKERLTNRGHLYTGGPFRYAQHINYFGEVVSFSGFAMLTRRGWAGAVPIAMLLVFVYLHIPALDHHLQEHYGPEFSEYQRRTKKLIPFIY